MGYLASAVTAVSSSPCVGHSLRTQISIFYYQQIFFVITEEIISALKIATLLHQLLSFLENCKCASDLILEPLYSYLSGSVFLVNFTALNRQFPNVKSMTKYLDLVSNS